MKKPEDKTRKVTIFDVARKANVSVASVSYVLNGRKKLSEATEASIRSAMEELAYKPRVHQSRETNWARRKREEKGRSTQVKPGIVVLLVADTRIVAAQTSQIGAITASASEWLSEFKLEMILAAVPPDGGMPLCLEDKRVRGVLLRGSSGTLSPALRKALERIPSVEFFGDDRNMSWDQVIVDDEEAGRMAFEHLRKLGCERFLALNPDAMHYSFLQRVQSFTFRAKQGGFPVEVLESSSSRKLAFDELAHVERDRLGIFVAGYNKQNDTEIMEDEMQRAGLHELCNVHRIGMGLSEDSNYQMLKISLARLGRMCAQQLVWRMEYPSAEARRILIKPRLKPAAGPGRTDGVEASTANYRP
ncbi:MAG: LacI family DNA-binding transcriptional regulator [Kiritimatiellia bacterium]